MKEKSENIIKEKLEIMGCFPYNTMFDVGSSTKILKWVIN